MASSSNNILQNCLNETSVVSATVSTNMIIGSPTVPIQNELSSNVSLDGFQQVDNKKKKKIKRKLATSATQKKRTRYPWRKIFKETQCVTRFQDSGMRSAAFLRDKMRFTVFLLR